MSPPSQLPLFACRLLPLLFSSLLLPLPLPPASARTSHKPYIVYMGNHHRGLDPEHITSIHHDMLSSVLGSKEAVKESILYSYTHALSGFAALLRPEHASALSGLPGVVSVFPNRVHKLDTTHSSVFLGLEIEKTGRAHDSLWNRTDYGRDVIIGMLDSGIWPESLSFNDEAMESIPSRWKGICEQGTNFTASNCNRKLVGARYYIKGNEAEFGPFNFTQSPDYLSPRDGIGHGTHTSSTAGGNFVDGANFYGFSNGTAKGMSPLSRIAMYKVCWPNGCADADVIAAFDDGIHEGVDIFSTSFGFGPPDRDYFEDSVAIGSFHAVQQGKVVVCSAGNDGPEAASAHNIAPWVLTVAASSIDRDYESYAVLGNHIQFKGRSLSPYHLKHGLYPLVSGVEVMNATALIGDSKACSPRSLDPNKTQGKIVACYSNGDIDGSSKGETVKEAGGVGMIICNTPSDGNYTSAATHVLPATHVNAQDGASIFHYINTSESPVAYITDASTYVNSKVRAPVMATFSSLGPNSITPDILKPDVSAPGVDILAAWAEGTALRADLGPSKFALLSGTSMSCPHVAGVSALLRSMFPTWTPAAIRSAIMTTATQTDNQQKPIGIDVSVAIAGPFEYGSGHINPNAAADPGLVYDITPDDYLVLLCSMGYNQSSIDVLAGRSFPCPEATPKVYDLNYPSIAMASVRGKQRVRRTLTSVGGKGTYKVRVGEPDGVAVRVTPRVLEFSREGDKRDFWVEMTVHKGSRGKYVFGHFTWTDGMHEVRSALALNAAS